MQIKNEFRKHFRAMRKQIANKSEKDTMICRNFLCSQLYKNASQILCYASLENEISTDLILKTAFTDSKTVALPKCTDENGNMAFYYVKSFSDIETGFFGIREPKTDICAKVCDFTNAVCIVPAFSYDLKGYRLGYGKGYYDRYLQKFNSISVGLCYNDFLMNRLPCDEYDKAVNFVFTEDKIIEV